MKYLRLMITCVIFSRLNFSQAAVHQQFYELGEFKLENGAVIKNCRIGYCKFGELNASKSNVILYPTWLGGTSREIAGLMGTDKLVDTTRYCVIAVDALGNGVSSSPSNSPTQPGELFPQYCIRDMVRLQYRLLTEKFGLQKIYAMIGGSLGSFQGFEWLVTYPDFISKAVLYVASPQMTSYDLLEIRTQIELIESGWRNHQPEAETARMIGLQTELLARTPAYRVRKTTRSDFAEYWKKLTDKPAAFSVADRYRQLQAILNHDIAKSYGGSLAQAARIIRAKTLIIVNQRDQIVNCQPALELAPLIAAETLILDSDCGHLAITCEMDTVHKRITAFLGQ